jgi:Cadherin-like/Bacterial Ig domain
MRYTTSLAGLLLALLVWGVGGGVALVAQDLSVSVTLMIPNTAPVVDLNGPAGGNGYAATFTEDGPAVAIVDPAALTWSDSDQVLANGASITITNLLDGASESLDVALSGAVSKSYNPTTGVLTLSGTESLAIYQAVLRTLVYANSSQNPTSTTRTVAVVVDDGLTTSTAALATVAMVALPDAPVVDLNGVAGGVDFAANFTEGDGAVLIVDPNLTVIDVDTAQLTAATVTVTNPLDGTNEVLAVSAGGGISASYDSGTGVLSLSGVASAAAYQSVLRSLTYNNTSANPTTTARTVTVTATDGALTSAVATTTVTLFAVNSTPTIDAIADRSVLEDSGVLSVALTGITNGGDGPGQVLTITAVSGNTALLLDPTVVYTSPSGTGTLLLAPVPNQVGTATVTVTVRDNGGTAQGSIDVTSRTFTVTVQPVNDRPTLAIISDLVIQENVPPQILALSGISAGPASEGAQALTITAISSRPDIIPNPTLAYTSPQSAGALTLTPVANTSGIATIIVTVRDNGGTANGGQDTFSRSFTVEVQPIPHIPVVATNNTLTVPIAGSGVVSYLNLEVVDLLDPAQLTYTVVGATTHGTLTRDSVALGAGDDFTQADINAGLLVYTHTGFIAETDGFDFTVVNSEGNTLPLTTFAITITGAAAGTIPAVTLPAGPVTWVQGGGAVLLDTAATVADPGGNLAGGTLTASLIQGGTSDDVLGVRHSGNGVGQIGVAGAVVSYEGVQIGTLSGGGSGNPLGISLSGPALPAAVEALVRNLTFGNVALAPTATTRRIQLLLSNGGGGVSAPVTKDVVMQLVNQAPVVLLPAGSVSYPEASPALVLDPAATFSDIDSPSLAGGVVTATWTINGSVDDQLWVRHEGIGANQIGVTGNAVSYDGAVIGFLSGGQNGAALTATLTNLATPTAAQALLRNLTFANASLLPSLALRQLSVVASDGDGGTSASANLTVVVQGNEDPPVITLPSPPTLYLQGIGALAIDPAATISDADSVVFTTGVLAAEFTAGADGDDQLLIHPQGSAVGEIDLVGTDVRYGGVVIGTVTGPGTEVNPLLVLLNDQATVGATQALLRRLAFRNDGVPPSEGTRTLRVTLTDGSGSTSLPVSTSITVQAVNAPPVVTVPGGGVSWMEGAGSIALAPAGTISDGDSPDFDGGSLTVSVTDAVGGEVLSVRNDGSAPGQIGVSGSDVTYGGVVIATLSSGSGSNLTLSFTAAATPAAAQAALRAVLFDRSGQLPVASTRTVQVVANDGQDASTAVTTTVSLVPVDDAPQVSATTLLTVSEVPAEGVLTGSDPEGAALTWEIVTAPTTGSLTLVDAATGAVRYVPAAGASGDVTFSARASDGTTWSAAATMTVRITDRLAAVRPQVISSPPREGFLGTALTYQVTVDLGGLPGGTDLAFHLVGIPSGSTATVLKTGATSATVTWTASGTPQQHQQLGLMVSDPVTGISSYQPIQVLWQAPVGGAG